MSTPASKICVCSGVRLDNRYIHTIWFDSLEAQAEYFAGKVVKTFSDYTYLRREWSIKVVATMEEARKWSYLFFQNGNWKTYYYFINRVEYLSDNHVELFLEMDVMQTYHFDYSVLRCFVEREHVSDDTVGLHIVDEGLDLGDFRVIDETTVTSMWDLCILVLSTFNPSTSTEQETIPSLGAKIDGVFSGLSVYAVNLSQYQAWTTLLNTFDGWGISDGIVAMWMYPKSLVTLKDGEEWTTGNVAKEVSSVGSVFRDVARNAKTSGDYEPRNNKLLTYPFNFLYVTNNNGASAIYRYERFGDPTFCNFKAVGSLSPEGSVKLYPINYNGVAHNYEEGLTLANYPSCAWNQDIYKLWLAQNQNQNALGLGMAGLKIVAGTVATFSTGGMGALAGAGTIGSGLSDIFAHIAQKRDMEVQPPQAKGNHSASVSVANGYQTFTLQRKSLGSEHAAIIDEFFDMYGYKINRVKVPNRKVREFWTYTKTINCKISGDFCNEDLTKIESIYDNGVTFWRNGDQIGYYNLRNRTLT